MPASAVITPEPDRARPLRDIRTSLAAPHTGESLDPARLASHPIRLAQAAGNPSGGGFFGNLFNLLSPKPKPEPKSSPEAVVVPGFGAKKKSLKLPGGSGSKASRLGAGASYGGSVESSPSIGKVKREGRYRTLCVRLCDGYYWPVSTKAPMSRFRRDKSICESSCGTEVQLFYQADLGGDAANMVDLNGKPYRKLKNAFLYRKQYVPSCKCRPEPWSASELMRHQGYSKVAEVEEPPADPSLVAVSAGLEDLASDETIDGADLGETPASEDGATGIDEADDLALAEQDAVLRSTSEGPQPDPIDVIKPAFQDAALPAPTPESDETQSITQPATDAETALDASSLRARHAVARER